MLKLINPQKYSIRRFILLSTTLTVALFMLVSSVWIYTDTSEQIEEIFDARLAQSARMLDKLSNNYLKLQKDDRVEVLDWLARTPGDPNMWHGYEKKLHFQLLNESGQIILRSPKAPRKPLGNLTLGFNSINLQDSDDYDIRSWRTFTLKSDTPGRWLIAAERDDVRRELTNQIAKRSLTPIVFSLLVISAAIFFILKHGFKPLDALSQTIARRTPRNFEPFSAEKPVDELTPLYHELNRLLASQKEALEREKQFTDAAAHELRTPLAILKIHAENALNAHTEYETRNALNKLVHGIDRSARLIHQLLVLARIENPENITVGDVVLCELLREVIAELTPLALRKHQHIELLCNEKQRTCVYSHAPLLHILFANLIDNAIRYTPEGGAITVELTPEAGYVHVSVADSGSGVAPEQLHRLGEAFFRADSGKGDGTGLGLAIVKRITQLLSIELAFANRNPAGLVVKTAFKTSSPS